MNKYKLPLTLEMASKKAGKIDLKSKYEIIMLVKSGMKKEDVRKKFGLKNRSNIHRIMKNEKRIIELFETSNQRLQSNMFKIKDPVYPDIEKAMVIWLNQMRSQNISISGPMIKSKAKEFAQMMNHLDFKATDGYIRGFKRRNNVVFTNEKRKSKQQTEIEQWKDLREENEEIIMQVYNCEVQIDEERRSHSNEDNEVAAPSSPQAFMHIQSLQRYFSPDDNEANRCLMVLQNKLMEKHFSRLKETKES